MLFRTGRVRSPGSECRHSGTYSLSLDSHHYQAGSLLLSTLIVVITKQIAYSSQPRQSSLPGGQLTPLNLDSRHYQAGSLLLSTLIVVSTKQIAYSRQPRQSSLPGIQLSPLSLDSRNYQHRWALMLEQPWSIIVYHLPTKENKLPLSVCVHIYIYTYT